MRIFVLFFLVVVCAGTGLSQDTTSHEKKGIVSTVIKKISDYKARLNTPLDSVQDSVSQTVRKTQIISARDSVNAEATRVKDSVNSLVTLFDEKTNLRNGVKQVEKIADKPGSTLQSKVAAVDHNIQEKIQTTEEEVNETVNKTRDKVNTGLSKATNGELKLPDKDLGIAGKPAVPSALHDLRNHDLSGVAGKEIPALHHPGIADQLNVNSIAEKTNINLPQQPIESGLADMGKVEAGLMEAGQYEDEINKIKEGDLASVEKLPALAENKVEGLEPVKEFTAQAQKVTLQQAEYEAMIRRYRDKKALQQEILRKAQHVANEALNQHSPAFKSSQEQLARVKRLNANVKSYKEIKKKTPNQMKGKTFREHLVPGVNVQAYNAQVFNIDWGAQMGYKVTSRFWAGMGGFFRTSFSEAHDTWIKAEHVYGLRAYLNFGLYKNFYAHGEFVSLRGKYDMKRPSTETESHRSHSGYVGLGRRYDVSKKIKGSILVLYRATITGDLPAMSRVNMRIEFNYNTRSKSRRQLLKELK